MHSPLPPLSFSLAPTPPPAYTTWQIHLTKSTLRSSMKSFMTSYDTSKSTLLKNNCNLIIVSIQTRLKNKKWVFNQKVSDLKLISELLKSQRFFLFIFLTLTASYTNFRDLTYSSLLQLLKTPKNTKRTFARSIWEQLPNAQPHKIPPRRVTLSPPPLPVKGTQGGAITNTVRPRENTQVSL